MRELALAFAGELDSVSMAELMWRESAPDPGRKRVAAQLGTDRGR